MQVRAFPWASLERVSRRTVRQARGARRALGRTLGLDALSRALASAISADALLVLGDLEVVALPQAAELISFELGEGATLHLEVEPALASVLLARILSRPEPLTRTDQPLGPVVRGALAALTVEVARRSGAPRALEFTGAPPPHGELALCATGSVLVDGRPFRARAFVFGSARHVTPTLAELGDLPVSLPLVVAVSAASRDELATLSVGDAWLPGEGLLPNAALVGPAALAAPGSERGIRVDLAPDGSLVVGDAQVDLGSGDAMSTENGDVQAGIGEAVLDAPVVVRVEVGSVSLTAREWAALGPGDVIETGRRVNEPVSLRVAGREVARGELVEVEGTLGVRIRELLSGGGP